MRLISIVRPNRRHTAIDLGTDTQFPVTVYYDIEDESQHAWARELHERVRREFPEVSGLTEQSKQSAGI